MNSIFYASDLMWLMGGNNFVFLLNSHKLGMQRSKNGSCTQCKDYEKIICNKYNSSTDFVHFLFLNSKFLLKIPGSLGMF